MKDLLARLRTLAAVVPLGVLLAGIVLLTHLWPAPVLMPFVRACLGVTFRLMGVRVRVTGLEHLDPTKGYVIVSNHVSWIDPFLGLYICPQYMIGMDKVENLKLRLYGAAVRRWGSVAVDRDDPASGRAACALAEQRVKAGAWLWLYPEGTRSRDGTLGPFKKGPFHVANGARVPLVAAGLAGVRALNRRGTWAVRPGTVEIRFGEALPPVPDAEFDVDARVAWARAEVLRLSGPSEPAIDGG